MASWLPWRRMATVFQPIKPVPPITTILIASLLVRGPQAGVCDGCAESHHQRVLSTTEGVWGAPFHSMTLSVTTRRQAILTRASALSKRQPERPRCMQGTMCRAVSPAVSDGKYFCGKRHPHVFGSAVESARRQLEVGDEGLVHEAPATTRFVRLAVHAPSSRASRSAWPVAPIAR